MVLLDNFDDILESLPQNLTLNLPVFKENNLELSFVNEKGAKAIYKGSEPVLPFANSDVFRANISSWRRVTAMNDGCKAVYEVTFDVKHSNFTFKAGDTIGIIPSNRETDVNLILSQLKLESTADLRYKLSVNNSQKASKIPPHIPVESTLRNMLTHCVDLRCILKKLFLLALSRYTKDEHERKVLEYFSSVEGTNAYQNHILNRNLCILDIFTIFKSCQPPIQVLLAHLPRLLPRPYSIVNSGLKNNTVLKICFSVMPLQNNRKGLTTGWLEKIILSQECDFENGMSKLAIKSEELGFENGMSNLEINYRYLYKIPIYLRKNISGFSLPECIERPLLLIGLGTGVAPFIAFLEELAHFKEKNPENSIGEVWLVFGCRNPKLDYIYEQQLNDFVKGGLLTKLVTAFSRVENAKFKYIQDGLINNSDEIAKLIESDASIFVCGDLKNMAAQVKETIIQCLTKTGKSLEESSLIVTNLEKLKKYVVDLWS